MLADPMSDPYAVAELAISNVASCREAQADHAYASLVQRWIKAKELAIRNGHGPRLQELDGRILTLAGNRFLRSAGEASARRGKRPNKLS